MASVRSVFSSGGPRDRATAIYDINKHLGFQRTGSKIRKALDTALLASVRRGVIRNDGQLLHPDCRAIEDYSRDYLIQYLLADMGRTWWDQDYVIRATAYYLGFRRTGPAIHAALKATIATAIRRGLLERDGDKIRKR